MYVNQISLDLARERQEQMIEELRAARRLGNRSSIRQSIGRRVIAVGRRIAAEPSLELARSR